MINKRGDEIGRLQGSRDTEMKKIKVIIADDSVVYRSQIRAALQDIPRIEILGVASNGRLALERLSQTPADLLILDLEMPEMDGLQTLTELRQRGINCKVLVFSSVSKRGAETTMEAFRLGASDFITKPSGTEGASPSGSNPSEKIKSALEPKILALFPLVSQDERKHVGAKIEPVLHKYPKIAWELFKPKIVVIGSSTGGPTVLEKMFTDLKGPLNCPIVIVQHMPPVFTTTFAERLEKISGIPTFEAEQGMVLKENCVYVAPGNYHLRLQRNLEKTIISLDHGPLINSVRPAVDPLFSTAADIYKNHCLGIILTGMGSDGKDGAMDVKQAGGAVVIQDEKSCVVFGMPGAVFSAGAFDRIASPKEIVDLLKDKIVAV